MSLEQVERSCSCCSKKCSNSDKVKIAKAEDKAIKTNLQRYGCRYAIASDEVREKIAKTSVERYGVDNPLKSSMSKQHAKDSLIERYGVDSPMKDSSVKEKVFSTNLEKYGSTTPFGSKAVHEKTKKTFIERYGVASYNLTDEFKAKAASTSISRYGTKSPIQSSEVKEKMQRTCRSKAYDRISKRLKDLAEPLFTKEEFISKNYRTGVLFEWRCLKCGETFADRVFMHTPRCPRCYPSKSCSIGEIELLEFCREFFPNASKTRKLIYPYEIDVCIDELKLALEFNGLYFHQLNGDKGVKAGYHLSKTLKCNRKGYRLIHIWEDDWTNHKDEMKSKLTTVLSSREDLSFSDDVIELRRDWYNCISIPGYRLIEERPPAAEIRNGIEIENCGFLIFKKD